MRLAESMVTPETECLLYATYWFRPILSELIGSALESSEVDRSRARGPVKVLVTDRPHRRTTGLVDLTSGASALLAWFPASWASKIAPKLLENALRMRRNHKKSTSHARNVPVTRLQWKEQNSCSKQ